MTVRLSAGVSSDKSGAPSTLPFDPVDVLRARVRPADFARMCGVSKQAVSTWIKNGVVLLGPDGLLDPVAALRDLIAKGDPQKVRVRFLKAAMKEQEELRARVIQLEDELRRSESIVAAYDDGQLVTRNEANDDFTGRMWRLSDEVKRRFPELVQAHEGGTLDEAFGRMVGAVVWDMSEDDLADFFDD